MQAALLPLAAPTYCAGLTAGQLEESLRNAWGATEKITGRTVLHVICANPDITEEVIDALAELRLPSSAGSKSDDAASDENDQKGASSEHLIAPAKNMAAVVSSAAILKNSNQNGTTDAHALHELCGNRSATFNMVSKVVDLCPSVVRARPAHGVFKDVTAFEVLVNKNDGKMCISTAVSKNSYADFHLTQPP